MSLYITVMFSSENFSEMYNDKTTRLKFYSHIHFLKMYLNETVIIFFLQANFIFKQIILSNSRRHDQQSSGGVNRRIIGGSFTWQSHRWRRSYDEPVMGNVSQEVNCAVVLCLDDFLLACVVMRLQSPIGFSLFPACNTQGRIQAHTGNNHMCLTDLADLHGMTATTTTLMIPTLYPFYSAVIAEWKFLLLYSYFPFVVLELLISDFSHLISSLYKAHL